MGKSAKKKRRKERQRQERLNQLSTFGALSLSTKTDSTIDTSSAVTNNQSRSRNESHDWSDSAPDDTQQHEKIPTSSSSSLAPSSRLESPANSKSSNVDTFGSSTNRARSLPVVAFVYPRCDSGRHAKEEDPKPYEFGTSQHEPHADLEQSRNNDTGSQHINRDVNKSKESIDDILYQKANPKNESKDSSLVNETKNDDIEPTSLNVETPPNALPKYKSETPHPLPYLAGISVEEAVRDKAGLRPRANSTDGELKLPQRGLCDERKVLECYKWNSSIGTSIATPKGFNNLGNTCFLNSTLQCLAYCPPLCQLLMNMPRSEDIAPNGTGKKVNQGKMFTLMLAALFRRVHNADLAKGALSPRKIVNALPLLGSGSTRRNGYKFRPGRQEDAHEFLVHLLDAMNDGELRKAGINANKSGWRDRLPVPRLDETTFVHRIFGGYLRSQVRCTDCGYRSNTYDPFMDLSLEISRNSCHSLSSAFNEFTRKETLDSQNRWKCSGCKKRVCATKQLTVFRPPLVLCVQLKRFTFGGSFSGFHGGGKKISKPIEFPAQLQLPLSDGRSCAYVLTGTVIHVGGSASSGHYTAYVQRPSTNGDRKWFHMDDSFVQPVSEQHVLRQHNAYVVMYCRQEVKIEFPTPPLRGSMTTDEAKELALSRQKIKSSVTNQTPNGNNDADEKLDDEIPTATLPSTSTSQINSFDTIQSEPLSNGSNGVVDAAVNRALVATEIKEPIGNSHVNGMKTNLDPSISALSTRNSSYEFNEVSADVLNSDNNKKFNHKKPASETKLLASHTKGQEKLPIPAEEQNNSFPSNTFTSKVVDKLVVPDKKLPSMDRLSPAVSTTKSKSILSTVSGDHGDGGKVEVVVRSQLNKQRAWIPKTAYAQKGEECVLLGDIPVSKWDDDDDEVLANRQGAVDVRTNIAKGIQVAEQDRKRKMFLDRHDALLDQGKVC